MFYLFSSHKENCKETAKKPQRNRKERAKALIISLIIFSIIPFELFLLLFHFLSLIFFNQSDNSFFTRAFELYLTLVQIYPLWLHKKNEKTNIPSSFVMAPGQGRFLTPELHLFLFKKLYLNCWEKLFAYLSMSFFSSHLTRKNMTEV